MIGNLGFGETVVILGVGLIVLGPRRLPEIGRMLGKAMAQFRRQASEFRETLEREVDTSEIRQAARSIAEVRDGASQSIWKALAETEAGTPPAAAADAVPPAAEAERTGGETPPRS